MGDSERIQRVLDSNPTRLDYVTCEFPTPDDMEQARQSQLGKLALRLIAGMVWPDGRITVSRWHRAQMVKLAAELRGGK